MIRLETFKSTTMRTVLATLVAGGLALGAAQETPATPETAQQPGQQQQQDVALPPGVDPDETVAQFGDDRTITQQQFAQEFDRAMRGLAMQHGLQYTDETRQMFERFRGEFLEMYGTQQALLREAEARGIEITDTELDQQLEQARTQWGDQFDATLRDLGYADEAQYREAVREGMLAQRVVDQLRGEIEWTDADLEQYHELHRTRYFADRPFQEVRGQVEQRFVSEQLQQRFADLRVEHGIEVHTDRLATDTAPAGVGAN